MDKVKTATRLQFEDVAKCKDVEELNRFIRAYLSQFIYRLKKGGVCTGPFFRKWKEGLTLEVRMG